MKFWHRLRHSQSTIFSVVAFSTIIAGIFSYFTSGKKLVDFWQGALDGFCISFLSMLYITLGRPLLDRFFRQFNFIWVVFFNALIYTLLFLGGRILGQLLGGENLRYFFTNNFGAAVVFVFCIILSLTFILQVNRLVGHNALGNFLSGKYHTPIEEARIFMFLDLANSTGLAEQLGDRRFHQLLNAFFYDLTEAVVMCHGRIYKYVGDEMIITWLNTTPAQRWRSVECFFLMQAALQARATWYRQHFGITPEFRAGLHAGRVVAGELGDVLQEVAYLGDVLNTTARLLEQCRVVGVNFLASEAIVQNLPARAAYTFTDAGEFLPRGKQVALRLYSAQKTAPSAPH